VLADNVDKINETASCKVDLKKAILTVPGRKTKVSDVLRLKGR